MKNYRFPFDIEEEFKRITKAHCEIMGYTAPSRPITVAPQGVGEPAPMPADERKHGNSSPNVPPAGAISRRSPDDPCYSCGTSDEPLAECSGCRAARLQEERMDRDRGER